MWQLLLTGTFIEVLFPYWRKSLGSLSSLRRHFCWQTFYWNFQQCRCKMKKKSCPGKHMTPTDDCFFNQETVWQWEEVRIPVMLNSLNEWNESTSSWQAARFNLLWKLTSVVFIWCTSFFFSRPSSQNVSLISAH